MHPVCLRLDSSRYRCRWATRRPSFTLLSRLAQPRGTGPTSLAARRRRHRFVLRGRPGGPHAGRARDRGGNGPLFRGHRRVISGLDEIDSNLHIPNKLPSMSHAVRALRRECTRDWVVGETIGESAVVRGRIPGTILAAWDHDSQDTRKRTRCQGEWGHNGGLLSDII